MRAIEPIEAGSLILHEFGVGYEVFGEPGAPAVLLLPPWQIVHSRIWKMQVPFLARRFRVITFDMPGNGRGERTTDPRAYEYERVSRQALGILDHLDIERAALVGYSRSCAYCIWLAATRPERVERIVLLANGVTPESWGSPPRAAFYEPRESHEGWEKENACYWREHYRDWLAFFFSQVFTEPHSTKGIEDSIGWGLETDAEILVASVSRPELWPAMPSNEAIAAIRCPVLLIHGDDDRCHSVESSRALAAVRPDWELVVLEGCSHGMLARDPVSVNDLVSESLTRPALDRVEGTRHARL